MPTYDYRCKKCGHRFELFHSIKDESVKRCPRCKGRAERVPSAGAGILFKGSGFYITDYRSQSYKEKAKADKTTSSSSSSESGSSSSSGGSSESKPKSSGTGDKGKKASSSRGSRGGAAAG